MDKETLKLIGDICDLVSDYVQAKQDDEHDYYKELQDELEKWYDADDDAIDGQEALDDYVNLLFNTIKEGKTDDSAEFHNNKRPINCKCKRAIKKARTSCN